jgi:F-type H+-transporting ATPase subunit b
VSFAILTGAIKTSGNVTTTTSAPLFFLPNATFIVELIIFIIVFAIVARFILPPLVKAMQDREELLSSSVTGAAESRVEANNLIMEADGIMEKARMEARQIIETASNEAADVVAKAKSEALEEYAKKFAVSKTKIETFRSDLNLQLEVRAPQLIIDMTQEILPTGKVTILKEDAERAYSLAKAARVGEV